MQFRPRSFAFLIALALPLVPAHAHHSTAPYDLIHGTIVSGTVTRFEWENPHSMLFLDVSTDGAPEHWVIEMESLVILRRLGWAKDTLKPGDTVTVVGSRAKDQSFRMRAGYVQWPDGHKLQCLPTQS